MTPDLDNFWDRPFAISWDEAEVGAPPPQPTISPDDIRAWEAGHGVALPPLLAQALLRQNGGRVRGADLLLVPLNWIGPDQRDGIGAAAFGDPTRLFAVGAEEDRDTACTMLDYNVGPEPRVLHVRCFPEYALRDEGDGPFERYIRTRLRGRAELGRWAGSWRSAAGDAVRVVRNRWFESPRVGGPCEAYVKVADVREGLALADLEFRDGEHRGRTCRAIVRLDGDTLHFCGTFDDPRPSVFEPEGTSFLRVFQRV
ncbi:MAG: hypothetical protein C0501_06755 [Isosphaera sp.]|nr:hypothetical protein [Isosphaera sp.]